MKVYETTESYRQAVANGSAPETGYVVRNWNGTGRARCVGVSNEDWAGMTGGGAAASFNSNSATSSERKGEWEKTPALRAEFGTFEIYDAYERNKAHSKILGGTKAQRGAASRG